jgi:hypothetical protein
MFRTKIEELIMIGTSRLRSFSFLFHFSLMMDRWLNFFFLFDDEEKWPDFNLMLMMTGDEWEIFFSLLFLTIHFYIGEREKKNV